LLRKQLRFGRGFRVIPGNRFSQAASQYRAALLRTLNFYSPSAYRKDGNPLPRGKS
jgi:hypothetical protein